MGQGPNAPYTDLDQNHILQRVFDESGDKLRVDANVTIGAGELVISQVDDSIRIGDGTNLVTTTSDTHGHVGLDVNLLNAVIDFTSSGLRNGLQTTRMTVTSTVTAVPVTPLANRNGISVRVMGNKTVYFGNDAVTAANGYPKFQYEEIIIDIKDNPAVELYAVCASGETCEIRIMEVA